MSLKIGSRVKIKQILSKKQFRYYYPKLTEGEYDLYDPYNDEVVKSLGKFGFIDGKTLSDNKNVLYHVCFDENQITESFYKEELLEIKDYKKPYWKKVKLQFK